VNVRSYGMKMPRLGTDDARKAVIPLPPLAEQSRIVTRVEELMRLCDALEAKGQLEATRHAQLVSTLLATLTDSGTPAQLPDDLSKNWHRIATHFDLLLDRPQAVDALEQTILQLAVRGLLVPQDPQDEPASVLLKKIRAEKDKLIAEGKIKRDKALSAIAEDERPFALPSGWSWARFPELGEFGRGKSKHRPRNDPALFNPPKYPLIQTGEVSRAKGIVQEVHSYYSAIGLAQSRMWPKGTLCITIAANIAESAVLGFDSCFPDSVVGFVPASAMGNVEYFLLFVETAKADLLAFAPATAQKNINLEILSSLLIPVPPLNELTRIVARVAQLRRLCFELRQRLSASQSTQAHLAEALVQSVG
jgi:type I restriction enzyme S subunit